MSTQLVKKETEVSYLVGNEEIRLSFNTVRKYLTKGNGAVTDQELVLFMSLCKFNQLNPFLNEAYLVKFGTSPAQTIVSKEALMKRAESHEQYDGLEGGLIIRRKNEILELEGNFYLEDDTILGAWAKVYRKDRRFPFLCKVNISEYDKKQSSWNEKKATMIAKVAKVQALREAFPSQLGAMYSQEEQASPLNGRTAIETEVIEQDEPQEVVSSEQEATEVDFKEI